MQDGMRNETIRHDGVVEAVDGARVKVRIVQASACVSCSARSMCSSAEAKEKLVDVCVADAAALTVGQQVTLVGRVADSRMAAMIAYGVPVVVLIAVLFGAYRLTGSDAQAAAWALLAVVVYYVCVRLFMRQWLQARFAFSVDMHSGA